MREILQEILWWVGENLIVLILIIAFFVLVALMVIGYAREAELKTEYRKQCLAMGGLPSPTGPATCSFPRGEKQ